MMRTGKIWTGTCTLIRELGLLSHRVNACFKYLVPKYHASLLKFREEHSKSQSGIEVIASIDPLLVEGRELLYNVRLPEHTDRQDPRKSMAAFTVFGEFQGGYVLYRTLGFRVRFGAGDFNLLRGRVVPHEIEAFAGQRIAIPHFTHTSCWRALGMESLVD
jgi:hypothetical protein